MNAADFSYSSALGTLTAKIVRGKLVTLRFSEETFPAEAPKNSRVIAWLDAFFRGENPPRAPKIEPQGTDFQKRVWQELLKLPFGTVTNYGEIARRVGSSPRAVGNACGKNPIALIIPCHRVIAAGGKVGGYAFGARRKRALLKLEGIEL